MQDSDTPIQIVINLLKSTNENYKIISSNENIHPSCTWMENSFPIAHWGRIFWENVPKSDRLKCKSFAESVEAIKYLTEKHELNDSLVTVCWTNLLTPNLEIHLKVMLKYAEEVLAVDFDTWIICPEKEWCIEIYHEGEVCFGYAPFKNNLSK